MTDIGKWDILTLQVHIWLKSVVPIEVRVTQVETDEMHNHTDALPRTLEEDCAKAPHSNFFVSCTDVFIPVNSMDINKCSISQKYL